MSVLKSNVKSVDRASVVKDGIDKIAELHVVEEKLEPPLVVPSVRDDPAERFIIVHSKDVEEENIALLKEYGKVILFDPLVYMNIPILSLEFDYLLLDIRRREDRYYFQQMEEYLIRYNIISYCYSIEKFEDIHEEIHSVNIMVKFPPKQAFKHDFDRLLLQKKISKPKPALSCFKSALRMFKGDWK